MNSSACPVQHPAHRPTLRAAAAAAGPWLVAAAVVLLAWHCPAQSRVRLRAIVHPVQISPAAQAGSPHTARPLWRPAASPAASPAPPSKPQQQRQLPALTTCPRECLCKS